MLLYRYITGQILLWTLIAATALIGMVWLSQTIGLIELLVNRAAALGDFVLLSILTIPLWITFILPVAVLIATMLTLNKMQQDREITMLHSMGMDNLAILRAPLSVGVFMSLLLYLNSFMILPLAYSGYKNLQFDLRTSAPIVILQEGVFTDITEGLTVFIGEKTGPYAFRDIFVHDRREEGVLVEIIADGGSLDLRGSTPQLVFLRGVRSEFTPGREQATLLDFDSYTLSITRRQSGTGGQGLDYNVLGIPALLRGENEYNSEKYTREMRAEGHFRLATPLLALVMAIIAAAAILSRRYTRAASWRSIVAGGVAAMAVMLGLIIARGLTITTPGLYPLMYAAPVIPALAGILALREGGRTRRLIARTLSRAGAAR